MDSVTLPLFFQGMKGALGRRADELLHDFGRVGVEISVCLELNSDLPACN
jgi:hypothetical protein